MIPTSICSTTQNGPPYSADVHRALPRRHRSHATTPSPTGRRPNSSAFTPPASPTARSPCCAPGQTRAWSTPRSNRPSGRPNMCYAGVPVKANRSAHGIAAACTLRNWIGMWSLRHAQTRAEPHLARLTCPALVINAEQDTGVYPSDAQRIYDALASDRQGDSARSTPTTTSPPRARAARRPIPSRSGSRSGGASRRLFARALMLESSHTSFPATRSCNSLHQNRIGSTSATAPRMTTTRSIAS